jgi:hypothetical protein
MQIVKSDHWRGDVARRWCSGGKLAIPRTSLERLQLYVRLMRLKADAERRREERE